MKLWNDLFWTLVWNQVWVLLNELKTCYHTGGSLFTNQEFFGVGFLKVYFALVGDVSVGMRVFDLIVTFICFIVWYMFIICYMYCTWTFCCKQGMKCIFINRFMYEGVHTFSARLFSKAFCSCSSVWVWTLFVAMDTVISLAEILCDIFFCHVLSYVSLLCLLLRFD